MEKIACLIGLGNPGPKYAKTRHNAGAWFIEQLLSKHGGSLKLDPKRGIRHGQITIAGVPCRVCIPETYMNESGQAVRAMLDFYKFTPSEVLIAHDELDLEVGDCRLKRGGGHGGHNGLRDIVLHLKGPEFLRLRIGIGHPGHKDKVSPYVLSPPSMDEEISINRGIDKAIECAQDIVSGNIDKAMHQLHTE